MVAILNTQFRRWNVANYIPTFISSGMFKHSRSFVTARDIYPEQYMYGHREILLQYMRLDFSHQIIGNLQHGTFFPGWNVDFRSPRYLFGLKTPYWVFSKELELEGHQKGFPLVTAIGAPWNYLPRNKILNRKISNGNKSILIMPLHSQGDKIDSMSYRQKLTRAKLFKKAIGSLQGTVCLHHYDYLDVETKSAFEEQDLKVVCIGLGSIPTPWSNATNRIGFLPRLMRLMASNRYFLTDGFGTALFYAIDMGLSVNIMHDIGKLFKVGTDGIETDVDSESNWKEKSSEYLSKAMPNSIDNFAKPMEYSLLANQWLGKSNMKSPEELIDTIWLRSGVVPFSEKMKVW